MEQRVFTKDILMSVNKMAEEQGYNRVVKPEFLEQLPDEIFVPWFTMLHEHKAGKACDPHVRCCFKHDEQFFTIDVEMGCWNLLITVSDAMAATAGAQGA